MNGDRRVEHLRWEDLRFFWSLARHGTLSATARALGVNHATVARHLARLEGRLGLILFDRRADGYVPTLDGEAVLAEVTAMHDATEAIAARAFANAKEGEGRGVGGTVRLTATRALTDEWLAGCFTTLLRDHPSINLEVLAESRNLSLARREAEVAIRLAEPEDGDVIARRGVTIGHGLYAAPAVAAAVRVGEDAPFIGDLDDQLPESRWLERLARGRRFSFRGDSLPARRAAAAAGWGVALLPHYLVSENSGLERLELEEEPPNREAWVLVRRDLISVPRVRVVVDWLLESFRRDAHRFDPGMPMSG